MSKPAQWDVDVYYQAVRTVRVYRDCFTEEEAIKIAVEETEREIGGEPGSAEGFRARKVRR